ncbi:hypothetical protein V7075_25595 [Neobacillus drentensis]|uniref:hypothetical protein n=1 Tax=Neobacillus drentensis TaxID=220684 RepID=UPI002FFF5427
MNVTGFGTLIDDSQIFQGTFGLNLLENTAGDDELLFIFSGFDQNGVSNTNAQTVTVQKMTL